ncbi:hypothetical protein JH06_3351 [Blastocystis sp. subtype 4]|uniref:hypothetical protein n=1 Tax=Blastocystis sp. subtype 4 TaxID=944170 RepID=UPI000712108C|nr:hypothetical protein JH06_3351 [Blastocystis sp. subtype 4]KNB42869.1 hypothetical protein JH06_3351 [Blastocystis sp. subtype 4]|eukprot:XP_014526312.1 hypothetical protein JH06_3351 [Blastocystis sp. subtype 4]
MDSLGLNRTNSDFISSGQLGGHEEVSCFRDYTIHNIVATININKTVNLEDVMKKLRNAEYNPKRFGALIVRIRDPRCTALIFKSGKIVLAGTKSEEEVKLAAKKFKCIGNLKQDDTTPRIHNMVAVGDCKFPIRLEGLSIDHIEFTTYEPELFSGLIYRMSEPKVVLLIFVSGKVVVTGATVLVKQSEIEDAFKKITPLLLNCRKV